MGLTRSRGGCTATKVLTAMRTNTPTNLTRDTLSFTTRGQPTHLLPTPAPAGSECTSTGQLAPCPSTVSLTIASWYTYTRSTPRSLSPSVQGLWSTIIPPQCVCVRQKNTPEPRRNTYKYTVKNKSCITLLSPSGHSIFSHLE